ncbi:ROK family protein [Alicyclobacillus tolerans]|uniref:ROK family protein n=1 Tax=Alicyclobacillus tolerans TaxID=90970 RepID=UPI003B795BD3
MTTSIDSAMMRRFNKTAVFRTIYQNAPISRVDIANLLEMNKATISSIVDELIAEEFVIEIGYGESRGGRKPMLLSLNENAGYCIGIDVQITHVTVALCNLSGKIIEQHHEPIYLSDGMSVQEALLQSLIAASKKVISKAPTSKYGVIGAGVAIPGMVNSQTGYLHYLPNLEIHEWNFLESLRANLKIPIFIDNDANCGALAVQQTCHLNHLVFVNVGMGTGVGIITNGNLIHGYDGIAGEFGHTTIAAMGLKCSCGSYGCWEQYASERALLRYLQEVGAYNLPSFPSAHFIEECVLRADMGDALYIRAFQTLGQHIGIGLANVLNGLNPQIAMIGGPIVLAGNYILPDIERTVANRAVSLNRRVKVHIASPETVVHGAAQLVLRSLLLVDIESLKESGEFPTPLTLPH